MKRKRTRMMRKCLLLMISISISLLPGLRGQCTFTNPVMEGADPYVIHHDGFYYMMVTRGDRVSIKRSAGLQRIHEYNEIVAWRFQNTPVGGHIWAPEMFRIDGKWYIYSCGQNTGIPSNPSVVPYVQEDQQMFVLESQSDDPLGPYIFKSWLLEGTGAIDETIFTHTDGKRYIIWSQFNDPGQPQSQCLYIAELINAMTVGNTRVKISCPELPWERNGWPVNEGPAVLQRNGKTFIVYSGSGYTTPEYALGYLVNTDGDLLNVESWIKVGPVFQQNPEGGVYSTGHNSFTTSPDGSEDWIVFHGRLSPDGNTSRYVFLQKFLWKGDEPFFGIPVPVGEQIPCPSGGRGQVKAIRALDENERVVGADNEEGTVSLWTVEPDRAGYFKQNARFLLVPGLGDETGLSLESFTSRGNYLRNENGDVVFHPYDGTEQFRSDATFYEREPWVMTDPEGVSLESGSHPGTFIRHRDGMLFTETVTEESLQSVRESATWLLEDAFHIFDCHGDYHGSAFIDSCGFCAGGNTGREPILNKYDCPAAAVPVKIIKPLHLYPNPAINYLYISANGSLVDPVVTVSDLMGRIRLHKHLEGNRIHVSGLADGIYFLSIRSQNSLYRGRFIKTT